MLMVRFGERRGAREKVQSMREDPIARRNRGNNNGLWLLGGLAILVVALLIAYTFKPQAVTTASLPEPAPISMAQRVQDDEARLSRQDVVRRSNDAQLPASATPATE
jgi:hypothetical protein